VLPRTSPIAHVVYFTWPSHGELTRYRSDQRVAWPSGLLLGRLMAKTAQFYQEFFTPDRRGDAPQLCGHRVHLAAHSMGAQVLEALISAVNRYEPSRQSLFGEILLLHADVDWTALEPGEPLHSLPEYGQRVHIYNHRSDEALLLSRWTKTFEKRLGRNGPRSLRTLPPRTIVVDCTSRDGAFNLQPDLFCRSAARMLDRPEHDPGLLERIVDHWGYLYRQLEIEDILSVLRGESSSAMPTRRRKESNLYALQRAPASS
jgi:esterase/lipase superfamily enzyme